MEHHSFPDTTVPAAYGAYSHAVAAGDFVFISGQIARHATGEFAGGDVASQTARCIEIVADILGRFDLTLADVARCTVYLADIADFPAMNAVFAEAFGATLPARSTPQVQMPFGAKVGLEVTAFRGSRRNRTQPRTAWLERRFPPIADNGLLPGILERLSGTPARLRELVAHARSAATPRVGWSSAKELGHLADVEPLWIQRVKDIVEGRHELTAGDLSNRLTHETDHDAWPLAQLVERFAVQRGTLVAALRVVAGPDLERSARHPRLGSAMRIVDLAYFVAEHDDHHMARIRELLAGSRA